MRSRGRSISRHPRDILRNEVWAALDEILLSVYTHENGQQMRVQAACIDSGYKDATVLRFTRDRYNRASLRPRGGPATDDLAAQTAARTRRRSS